MDALFFLSLPGKNLFKIIIHRHQHYCLHSLRSWRAIRVKVRTSRWPYRWKMVSGCFVQIMGNKNDMIQQHLGTKTCTKLPWFLGLFWGALVPKADSGKHHDFLVVHFLSLQSVMGFCDIRIHHLWGKELQAGNDDVSEALRIEIEMFINPRRPRVVIYTTLIDMYCKGFLIGLLLGWFMEVTKSKIKTRRCQCLFSGTFELADSQA